MSVYLYPPLPSPLLLNLPVSINHTFLKSFKEKSQDKLYKCEIVILPQCPTMLKVVMHGLAARELIEKVNLIYVPNRDMCRKSFGGFLRYQRIYS